MARVNPRNTTTRKKALKAGFRSGLEMRIAKTMDDNGISYEYEPRDKIIEYYVPVKNALCKDCGSTNIVRKREYLIDFIVGDKWLEVKGRFTAQDRKKMIAVRECASDKNFVIVLQAPNAKVTKRMTAAEWCDKNNFEWVKSTQLLRLLSK